MPVVTVTLMEGYEEPVREDLASRLTRAVQGAIDAPPDGITVLIHELPPANYMRGGSRRTPGPPSPPAITIVRSFLDAMEARDLEAAGAHLADGFTMTFPGGARFTTLEQLVDWAKDRYQNVAKRYEHPERPAPWRRRPRCRRVAPWQQPRPRCPPSPVGPRASPTRHRRT